MDSALNKNGHYYPQVFWKSVETFKKNVIRHIIDDLESSCDDSDEEWIKATKLMFLETRILKM